MTPDEIAAKLRAIPSRSAYWELGEIAAEAIEAERAARERAEAERDEARTTVANIITRHKLLDARVREAALREAAAVATRRANQCAEASARAQSEGRNAASETWAEHANENLDTARAILALIDKPQQESE